MALIRFSNVSKRYRLGVSRTSVTTLISRWVKGLGERGISEPARGYHLALRDVNFELEAGRSLALIGPNGAGKSTILKLLARITVPTAGTIEVGGKVSALIELGAGFHPDLTGRENVFLNGTILGLRRQEIKQRFEEIVAFADLDRFIDTPLKRYSSGMTVRLGFAVAACMRPAILLVDEVLAVGDAAFRQRCVERIRELLNQGTSLIFVSHNLDLVGAVCERALFLEEGKIREDGASDDVIEAYNKAVDLRRAQALESASDSAAGPGAGIEITKVEVVPLDKVSGGEVLQSNRSAEVRVHYLAYRPLGLAHLVVRIYRSDGLSCCVMYTSDDGFQLSVEKGPGSVALTLEPLQLSGGLYHAVAWIKDSEDIAGLARGASGWFEVVSTVPGRRTQDGVYAPRRRWRQASAEGKDGCGQDFRARS